MLTLQSLRVQNLKTRARIRHAIWLKRNETRHAKIRPPTPEKSPSHEPYGCGHKSFQTLASAKYATRRSEKMHHAHCGHDAPKPICHGPISCCWRREMGKPTSPQYMHTRVRCPGRMLRKDRCSGQADFMKVKTSCDTSLTTLVRKHAEKKLQEFHVMQVGLRSAGVYANPISSSRAGSRARPRAAYLESDV